MNLLKRYAVPVACAMTVLTMAACSSTKDERREPTPLTEFKPVLDVQQAWKTSVGKAGRYLFSPVAVGNAVYAAGANGSVAKIDAQTGKDIWRVKLRDDLSAGVGSDGTLTAVGGLKGDVYVLGADGKQLWTAKAPGEIISPPLVGNGLVVVRTVDGQIVAFNAQTGEQKWNYRNRAVPLNLRVSSGMTFAGDAAVLAGFPGGAFAAINLQTGDNYWQTPVSYPKGVTEVERINDVTGPPTLLGSETCAVTFQGQIGCFDANSGRAVWEKAFSSTSGLAQDDRAVVAADDWSVVSAFDVSNGATLWKNDKLKNRELSVPFILGHAAVLGDYQGYVHFLSRDDGTLVARVKTDGTPITAAPVLAGETLVVLTHDGDLYGYRPR
ncbi:MULTISPECIES: outer membrane protein assembly factor BamB [Paraburkholderia]|jgi:outer membrane protein assembly factor BamB|uniref:Outer membrane protein assembly factor BamB n=1 Tax=Paraburkholderia aspalathi TaxID=1324617 RepID=A0A1I7AEP1_9BURK|nr:MULTISPECIES: outer membrane protein assembly factor BamB [Paraburkholderia]MBK3817055.1 outer membrane protein assembly factor BamB [Paraburkholderia aspalathi]MBK3828907.1 outer membrane protein assembly factor BamB [Paraburkholderia aspalathi]MBK3836800.1 outer membrane protein assembly factor BamB [Paraburkholderia aspalathi]MBK3858592.1 outer membrane protein assembly factor BamB [Paraburkholderia aspalathi]MCX4137860.1 outer membrane protein assembly factor BamB [Paraburkholderia aspa